MPGKNLQSHLVRLAAHRGNDPVLKGLLGLALVAFFLLALMLQIQSSEAFLLNSQPVGLAPNWGVLLQPVQFLHGELPINTSKAVLWGWGIELVYLICVIGEVTVHGRWHKWFQTGAIALVAFNFWTDFNYGALPSGLGGQFAFAAITSFVVAFFGVIGLNMIWSAITELSQ